MNGHAGPAVGADRLEDIMTTPGPARPRVPLAQQGSEAVKERPLPGSAGALFTGRHNDQSADAGTEARSDSGFVESATQGHFSDSNPQREREYQDAAARDVKELRCAQVRAGG